MKASHVSRDTLTVDDLRQRSPLSRGHRAHQTAPDLKRLLKPQPDAAASDLAVRLLAPIAYMVFACMSTIMNRTLLGPESGVRAPFAVMLVQSMFSLTVCGVCLLTKASLLNRRLVDPIGWRELVKSLPLGVSATVNLGVGLTGQSMVPIPVYGAIRRSGTVVTMLMQAAASWAGGKPRRQGSPPELWVLVTRWCAIVLLVLGSLIMVAVTPGLDPWGVAVTVSSMAFTSGNSMLVKRMAGLLRVPVSRAQGERDDDSVSSSDSEEAALTRPGLSSFAIPPRKVSLAPLTMVTYNYLVMAPLALVIALSTGELAAFVASPWPPWRVAALLVSSTLGMGVTLSVFMTTNLFSPTAMSVVGNLKDAILWAHAILLGERLSPASNLAMSVNFVGSIMLVLLGAALSGRARTGSKRHAE